MKVAEELCKMCDFQVLSLILYFLVLAVSGSIKTESGPNCAAVGVGYFLGAAVWSATFLVFYWQYAMMDTIVAGQKTLTRTKTSGAKRGIAAGLVLTMFALHAVSFLGHPCSGSGGAWHSTFFNVPELMLLETFLAAAFCIAVLELLNSTMKLYNLGEAYVEGERVKEEKREAEGKGSTSLQDRMKDKARETIQNDMSSADTAGALDPVTQIRRQLALFF